MVPKRKRVIARSRAIRHRSFLPFHRLGKVDGPVAVDDDFSGPAIDAVAVRVFVSAQLPDNFDAPTFPSVLLQHLCEAGDERLDIVPVGALLPFVTVPPTLRGRDAKARGEPAARREGLHIGPKPAGDNRSVHRTNSD